MAELMFLHIVIHPPITVPLQQNCQTLEQKCLPWIKQDDRAFPRVLVDEDKVLGVITAINFKLATSLFSWG